MSKAFSYKEPAPTIHDLNSKRISQTTPDEYNSVKEDWDVHFNDNDFRDGRFKVTGRGLETKRFHDKADAINHFYGQDTACYLWQGKRLLMSRET